MLIDLTVLLVLIFAVFKGLRQGLIVAVFSLAGLLIGLAAALKLSALTAAYLSGTLNVGVKWLPVLSFLLVFIASVMLVRLIATALQKTVELAMLGWANRIGGMVAYGIIYLLILSVTFFYLEKIQLISDTAIAESKTYPLIRPLAPRAIGLLGSILPFLKDIFAQLSAFFETVANVPPAKG
ncbi:MAG: CvpA family protein [Chitinophagaceae bacterium]